MLRGRAHSRISNVERSAGNAWGKDRARSSNPAGVLPRRRSLSPSVSSHAVRLWSVLASYTYGDRATDRPSRAQLAADVGWKSPRSVDTYLTELQDAGYLTIERRWRPDGGKSRNLYILEWERQNRTTSDRPADPHPVDSDVSAAQTHAQDPAHLEKEPTSEKEPPPAELEPSVGDTDRPCTDRPDALALYLPAEIDALVGILRCGLPDRLRLQLSTPTLRRRAEALAVAGWTEHALRSAVTSRGWDGAGCGAVVTGLTDLAAEAPVQPSEPKADPRAMTLRCRAEAARARSEAATPDSPARQQAREFAAELGRRRR